MAEEESDNYISLQEAKKFCKYSQEYLSLRARQGKLKAVKFGRNWLTKKEWLEEYLQKVEEYKNNLKVKKKVQPQPPENLPVEPSAQHADLRGYIRGFTLKEFFQLRQLRFALSIGLVLVLIIAGGVLGKESLRNVYETIDPYVHPVRDFIVNSVIQISDDISNGVQEFAYSVDKGIAKGLEDIGEGIKMVSDSIFQTSWEVAAIFSPEVLENTLTTFKEYGQWVNKNLKSQISNLALLLLQILPGRN